MIALLRKRRSIRKFLNKKITPKTIRILQESLLRSPSSRDNKPWYFIFVNNTQLLNKLSRCKKHGSSFLASAPLGIVVCGDEQLSDVWVEDCSIAGILVQMVALSCGLGSCWIQIRNRETGDGTSSEAYVRGLLKIPCHLRICLIVAIGHPAEKKMPIPLKKLCCKKIRLNEF
ncbi:MAG: nitroreductase family protein [Chitinispirillaceae bacterium]|jgi:nitroreductase